MFKISTGVAALLVASLLGLACTNQAGLNSGEKTGGAGGAAKGGQTGGVAGGSGGTIGVGGIVTGGSSGTIGTGGVGAGGTSGSGGSGGKTSCLPVACPALTCVGGFQPNSDPCGCPICVPNADAGVAKDAGGPDTTPVCPLVACPMLACVGGYLPNPEPCGCPICASTPDAGVTKDAGSPDGPTCPGPVPPCVPPPKTCPAGYQLNSPPCGCTGCVPVDGGTAVDGGKPDAPLVCNVMCPMLACVGGYLPNPEPCGCPICAPNSDAGVTSSDAGLACCPTGFVLYGCTEPDGGAGFACHNPALGCASSLTCGQGCDPQVSGRCQCVQTGACILGYHPDPTLCQCVPDRDAGAVPPVDAQPACVDNVLCIKGDHFDTTLCKCVPDASPTTPSCSNATDCTGGLPALCQLCANGSYGCAHFMCVAGQCKVAYCP